MTKQSEALRLADKYEIEGFLRDHQFAKDYWCMQAALELRRLHAREQELERYKKVWEEWQEKTDWVRATSRPKELGMHRADVLKLRIQELESEAEHNARILGASAEKELRLLSHIEELTKMLRREEQ